LIAHCSPSRIARAQPSQRLSPRALAHVTEYIDAHLDRTLPLAELARLAGVSTSHFKTLFTRSTQMPVHRYVVARRVERARRLLDDDDMTLVEIAMRSGFSDQSHMARWMRRVLGTTPAALKRRRS